jgi:hypothetical protein
MHVTASRPSVLGFFAAVSLLALSAQSQAAMDPKKLADQLVAGIAASDPDFKASYARAAAQGQDVVISGFKIVHVGGTSTWETPSLVVVNPTERPGGGFTSARMTFDKGQAVNKGNTASWTTGSVEGVTYPSPDEMKKGRQMPFTKLSVNGISVNSKDMKAPVTIASVSMTATNIKDGMPSDGRFAVEGITLPAALFTDPRIKGTLDQLGYTNGFTASLVMEGAYARETDTTTARNIAFNVDGVGRIIVTGVIAGMPLSKAADGSKVADVVGTATLNSGTIRFENAGVVERALDMQAKTFGMPRKDFVANTITGLPFLLSTAIRDQAFVEKLKPALATFLNDPKSLTLISTPKSPLPFRQILSIWSAPQTLSSVLALDVQANK